MKQTVVAWCVEVTRPVFTKMDEHFSFKECWSIWIRLCFPLIKVIHSRQE